MEYESEWVGNEEMFLNKKRTVCVSWHQPYDTFGETFAYSVKQLDRPDSVRIDHKDGRGVTFIDNYYKHKDTYRTIDGFTYRFSTKLGFPCKDAIKFVWK